MSDVHLPDVQLGAITVELQGDPSILRPHHLRGWRGTTRHHDKHRERGESHRNR